MSMLGRYRAGDRSPDVVAFNSEYRKAARMREKIMLRREDTGGPGSMTVDEPCWFDKMGVRRERKEYEKAMKGWDPL
jgi:hypothetical protein